MLYKSDLETQMIKDKLDMEISKEIQNLSNLTVLYAEDDEDTLNLTSMVLGDYVGRLITARDGQEAWKIFSMHKVDIVLTDILMPKMNGLELISAIRKSNQANTPVVITTAHTEVKYLLDAIELKVDNYVVKPIDISGLLRIMQKTMLPFSQAQQIESQNMLIKAIGTFVGGKKIEIIKYLIEHADKDSIFYGSYEDIIANIDVSKPTVVKTFKQLINTGILIKVKNKIYKFHPDFIMKI